MYLINRNSFQVSETQERINIERLKTREKILFFEQMMLFEDELADNGCAQLTVKIVSGIDRFAVTLRDSCVWLRLIYLKGSQTFYDLVPLGHLVLSTRTTSSRTANLIES